MSFEALAAVSEVEPPTSSSLLLLFILAEYAGPDGTCHPSQTTLAKRAKLSERGVRDNLTALVAAGLIEMERRTRKDGTRTSNCIRLLFYTPKHAGAEDKRRTRQPADTAAGAGRKSIERNRQSSPVDQRQISTGQPAMVAGLTTFEPVREPTNANALDAGARAGEAQDGEPGSHQPEREQAKALWAAKAPERVSPSEVDAAWDAAMARITPPRLLVAVKAYLASGEVARGHVRPMAKWLTTRSFEPFLLGLGEGGVAPAAAPMTRLFEGPDAVRSSFLAAGFPSSWIDGCGWRGGDRTILAGAMAVKFFRREAAAWLKAEGLRVGDKVSDLRRAG